MDAVTSANQSQANVSGALAISSQEGKTTLSSDFETFLKMLTVQLQNQDPLNPVDSSEYAVQLATFSSVEQQVLTNDLLAGLAGQFGTLGMAQMAHWVGMEGRVSAPVHFDGDPIEIVPQFEKLADMAVLVVRDSLGTEVQRLNIDPSETSVLWDGASGQGEAFASGQYTFEVESHADGELLATSSAQVYARIDEVQSDSGETILVLEGGAQVTASAVTALRES